MVSLKDPCFLPACNTDIGRKNLLPARYLIKPGQISTISIDISEILPSTSGPGQPYFQNGLFFHQYPITVGQITCHIVWADNELIALQNIARGKHTHLKSCDIPPKDFSPCLRLLAHLTTRPLLANLS